MELGLNINSSKGGAGLSDCGSVFGVCRALRKWDWDFRWCGKKCEQVLVLNCSVDGQNLSNYS